jgi:simple sugar transport system substrate-binding protein
MKQGSTQRRNRLATIAMAASLGFAASTQVGLAANDNAKNAKDLTFVSVVKLTGIAWFNRMETGVKKFGENTGIEVRQVGPARASQAQQNQIIQNLIPRRPDAIVVDPNSYESASGVLRRAMNSGITVVTQEAAELQNTDADIEAFDNTAYGEQMMDSLAKCMGKSGKYAQMVGHLTAASHMAWAKGALQEAKDKYPKISRIGEPVESDEDLNTAYRKAKELLTKYPDLKGFLGSAATDVIGIAKAAKELGVAGDICIVGTSIPSLAKTDIKDGSIYRIFLWDPAQAGKAAMHAALMIDQGKKITKGTDLKVDGYHSMKPCGTTDVCWTGDAAISVGKDNLGKYHF